MGSDSHSAQGLPVDTQGNVKVNVVAGGAGGGAVTVADGADVTQGAKADAAWSGVGDGTVVSILKKLATAGGGATSIADGADVNAGSTTDLAVLGDSAGTISAKLRGINSAVSGTLNVNVSSSLDLTLASSYLVYTITAPDTGLEADVAGMGSVVCQKIGSTGGFAEDLLFQGSNDGGVTWNLIPYSTQNDTGTMVRRTGVINAADTWFQSNIAGWRRIRIQATSVITGTVTWRMSWSQASYSDHLGTRIIGAAGGIVAVTGGGALTVDPTGTSITVRSFDTDGSNPSSDVYQVAGQYNDALGAVTVGRVAAARLSKFRALHTNLRDNNGTELASSTSAPAGTELGLITRNIPSGTQTISGTVTANAGSNLNTSLLALDSTLTSRSQKSQITDGTRDGTVKAASTLPAATDTALVVTTRDTVTVSAPTTTVLANDTPTGLAVGATGAALYSTPDGRLRVAPPDSMAQDTTQLLTLRLILAELQAMNLQLATMTGEVIPAQELLSQ
jgi:hypothetical protein